MEDGRWTRQYLVEEEVLAWGEPEETLRRVLAQLAAGSDGEGPELISVLAGEHAPLGLAEVEPLGLQELARSGEPIELELRQGDQPAYWWLLAAE